MDLVKSDQATLTKRLLSATALRDEVRAIRKQVTFEMILKNDEPNFRSLSLSGQKEHCDRITTGITLIFLKDNFSDQSNIDDVALSFSDAIIEREPSWQLADVVNFFKFILMRQDLPELKVFGNKMTVIRLLEMVSVYEDHKAQARESLMAGTNTEPEPRSYQSNDLKTIMGRQMDKIQAKGNGSIIPMPNVIPDEKFFKRKNS